MESTSMKNYQFFIGLLLVLAGILIFSFLPDPVRFSGFIFIIGAAIYFIIISSSNIVNRNKNSSKFRSRTRDQILKHHYRR